MVIGETSAGKKNVHGRDDRERAILFGLATLNFEEKKAPSQSDQHENDRDDRPVKHHTFRAHSDRSLAF
jgi:hypothetical protein